MKLVARIAFPALLTFVLASCSDSGTFLAEHQPVGTGPFDSRGNYVDDWADSPDKWRQQTPAPTRITTPPVMAKVQEPPVIARIESPSPVSVPITVAAAPPPARITTQTTTRTVQVKPKPKPKPVAKKPVVTRHVVKKGDTLTAIARRYSCSVATIQRANKISGSLIHPGKSLVIPR